MAVSVLRLDRVAMNVADLDRARAFYEGALGCRAEPPEEGEAALARLLGVRAVRRVRLWRGAQRIELTQTDPAGAPALPAIRSNDARFQHCALHVADMAAAYRRLAPFGVRAISTDGPQRLPGGIVAFKFRDSDGHPLELIQFPDPDGRTLGGLDHSAITVTDVARSIGYYREALGLEVTARQINAGPEQDWLDGVTGTCVEVVALSVGATAPHVELLGYRTPQVAALGPGRPSDLAATRLVFSVAAGSAAEDALSYDPDGHLIHLEAERGSSVG